MIFTFCKLHIYNDFREMLERIDLRDRTLSI